MSPKSRKKNIRALSPLSLSLHAPSLSSLPRRQQHLVSGGSGATTPLGAALGASGARRGRGLPSSLPLPAGSGPPPSPSSSPTLPLPDPAGGARAGGARARASAELAPALDPMWRREMAEVRRMAWPRWRRAARRGRARRARASLPRAPAGRWAAARGRALRHCGFDGPPTGCLRRLSSERQKCLPTRRAPKMRIRFRSSVRG